MFNESFKLWSSCIALVSDFETAFLPFENSFLINCFCLLITFFHSVCLFVLMFPTVCLCGVITGSYLSSLVIQFCNISACLFTKLTHDLRFRMMDAILGLAISSVLNC